MSCRRTKNPPLIRMLSSATGVRFVIARTAVDVDNVKRVLRLDGEDAANGISCRNLLDDIVHRCVREHVPVVGEEHLVVTEILAYPAQTLTDRGLEPGVDKGDPPITDVGA